jgi:hypothetical protein
MTSGIAATAAERNRSLFRWGGLAGIAIGLLYVVIIGLYSAAGVVPSGAEAWLAYLAQHVAIWWGIAGLSVLTDVLFLPLALGLYVALRGESRNIALAGAVLVALFAVLDLAVTWPSYAALIELSGQSGAAPGDAQHAVILGAATYPAAVLGSILFKIYAILIPALGVMALGWVMLRGRFSRTAGWLGLLTGIFGIVTVFGSPFISALATAVILTSVLTLLWVVVAGYRLYALSRAGS